MQNEPHLVPTPDGWLLSLGRTLRADGAVEGAPVLVVPGYGMNSTLFGYHPHGRSFLEALSDAGFDAWTVDFRGHGESRRDPAARPRARGSWGLREYAFVDLKAAVEHVCAATGRGRLTAVGCSLGGSIVLTYAARFGTARLERYVGMGAPLLQERSGVLGGAAGLAGPALAVVPMRGVRTLVAHALPLAARYGRKPLSIYLNADHVDLSRPDLLARVVENPSRRINAEIARWIRTGRLVVDGLDVAECLRGLTLPTLLVVALGDGIVNPASARSVRRFLGEDQVDEVTVGGPDVHVAHADLFISDVADEAVFQPVIAWLRR